MVTLPTAKVAIAKKAGFPFWGAFFHFKDFRIWNIKPDL